MPDTNNTANAAARFDHLVVMADTLQEGADWCQRTLGVAAVPGGRHTRFGTHNLVLRIDSAACPNAYLEIIAIDPQPEQPPQGARWFDMDDAALRERVRHRGPQLIHWVAAVPDLDAACARLAQLGIDRGIPSAANRMAPRGLLEWRIAVRADGQRLMDGCLPTLIQWGAYHPAQDMPASGVVLQSPQDVQLQHPQADTLRTALQAAGLVHTPVTQGPPALRVRLQTPGGEVWLEGGG